MLEPASSSALSQKSPLDAIQGIDTSNKTAVRQASEDFEAIFINNMLQSMFTGLAEGGTWGNGAGADAWQGFLIDEYARSIAESGGIGLADSVERELLAIQEGSK